MNVFSLSKKSGTEITIIFIKISIIAFFSFYFLSNFQPYYEGADSYVNAITSIKISQGSYEITNPLLQQTGLHEFVPRQWVITQENSAIPAFNVGLPVIGSIFYSLFGYYGLFYLIPLCSISLLVVSERLSTKLFGSLSGLITLIFVSSNLFIIRTGTDLLTGNISTVFILIGFFYLIKFFETPKNYYVLIISSVLVISTLLRIGNLAFFPLELVLIIGFLILKNYKNSSHLFSTSNFRKNAIRFTYLLIPWLIFFSFWFSYNDYYFDDPLKSYLEVKKEMDPSQYYDVSSFTLFPTEENLENFKIFSQYLLPYPLSGARALETNYESILGTEWLGFISMIFLTGILLYSIFTKTKRIEIFMILFIIVGIVWFYSSVAGEIDPERSVAGRYMIPSFVFTSFLFGFVANRISSHNKLNKDIFQKISKIIIIVFSILFFVFALSMLNPITDWMNSENKVNNPVEAAQRYPLDKEGLGSNSIIVNTVGAWVVDYDLIPFHPFLGVGIHSGQNPDTFPEKPILLLENLLNDGHNVYTFKESSHRVEKKYLNHLITNHNFVLNDFSESFCKLELKTKEIQKSDDQCL